MVQLLPGVDSIELRQTNLGLHSVSWLFRLRSVLIAFDDARHVGPLVVDGHLVRQVRTVYVHVLQGAHLLGSGAGRVLIRAPVDPRGHLAGTRAVYHGHTLQVVVLIMMVVLVPPHYQIFLHFFQAEGADRFGGIPGNVYVGEILLRLLVVARQGWQGRGALLDVDTLGGRVATAACRAVAHAVVDLGSVLKEHHLLRRGLSLARVASSRVGRYGLLVVRGRVGRLVLQVAISVIVLLLGTGWGAVMVIPLKLVFVVLFVDADSLGEGRLPASVRDRDSWRLRGL